LNPPKFARFGDHSMAESGNLKTFCKFCLSFPLAGLLRMALGKIYEAFEVVCDEKSGVW
jgi:hypothetical protein